MTDSEYDPRALIASSKIGILATLRSSGIPQLSPVTTVYDRDAGTILVSITEDGPRRKIYAAIRGQRSSTPVPTATRGRRRRGR